MAYAETLTSRECPTDMFSEIEKRTAAHVLKIVYGNEQEGEVDTRAHHGRPNTFMAMKVVCVWRPLEFQNESFLTPFRRVA